MNVWGAGWVGGGMGGRREPGTPGWQAATLRNEY